MKTQTVTEPAYLRGAFLTNYLFADVLFSQYCTQDELRDIYDKYAKAFCICNREWLNDIWNVVSSDLFNLADNTSDFNRLVRLAKQYPHKISPLESYVLSQKATAIQIKSDILLTNDDASFDTILRILERKANSGDTDCIALFGFLEYHGILVNQNTTQAETRFETAATWSHLFAILMGCHYASDKNPYYQKLCALLNVPSNESIWEYLKTALDISADIKADKIALALEYAFCQGSFQACKVNHDVMKLVHSSVLNENAKSRLIKAAKGKDFFSSEIPLNVTKNSEIFLDLSGFSTSTTVRQAETDQICANLGMIDLRDTSVYKPLLIVCEDELVLDYYRESIKSAFSGAPLAHIYLHEGDKCNLSHSHDNIFIASMEKHGERNVVMLLDHCETLNPEGSAELARFLKAANRKHYKSGGTPPVEIDLSGVLPILFASTIPDANIAECCDIVIATELTKSEFREVLDKSLKKKCEVFKLTSLSMEPTVADFLFEYSSATVTNLLNKAIGQLRGTTKDVHITVAVLQGIIDKFYSSKSKNGFWRDAAL